MGGGALDGLCKLLWEEKVEGALGGRLAPIESPRTEGSLWLYSGRVGCTLEGIGRFGEGKSLLGMAYA